METLGIQGAIRSGTVTVPCRSRWLRRGAFVLCCAAVASCTPLDIVRQIGPDAAYTAREDRSLDDVWDDNKLKLALDQALLDDSVGLFASVGTVVYEGRVLLVGSVSHRKDRALAERIARAQPGVRRLTNRIQVTDQSGVLAYGKDFLIEKDIQAQLFFDDTIASANLRVRSVNGIVYLFGAAADRREMTRTLAVARSRSDVRRVENLLWVRPRH